MTGRAGRLVFLALLTGAILQGAAEGAGEKRLRLCNPGGEIRADRTREGLRIRYIDGSGPPGKIDFTLPGWEVSSVSATGKKACIELKKSVKARRKSGARAKSSGPDGALSAKDEVIEYGGAFQDKVIIRRGERTIDLGGEKITIREMEVISPGGNTGPLQTKPE